MNTLKTDFREEQEMIKHLFQELFVIQIELENYVDPKFHFHLKVKNLMRIIDQLMQILFDMYWED